VGRRERVAAAAAGGDEDVAAGLGELVAGGHLLAACAERARDRGECRDEQQPG
jgi:hypothetical protein